MENSESGRIYSHVDYLKIFFRRKWLIITPAYIGLVVGIIAALLMPRVWQSYTTILIEEPKIINPLIQDLAISTTAAQRMQSIKEILLGWNSMVELTKKLDLAKNITTQLEFENLIMRLRKNIVVQINDSNRTGIPTATIIKISYLSEEPKQTQMVAQALTDILMARSMESQTKETDVAIKFITDQLAIYKRKVKESEIAQLQEQLTTLLLDSTEQHPMVKELRSRIETATKELNSGNYQVKGAAKPIDEITKQALQQELDRIVKQESQASADAGPEANPDANTAIYKLMLADKVGTAMARDTGVNDAIYQMLLKRLETAKITQRLDVSREGTRYTIIEPPRLPLTPVKPNKLMVMFMGLLLGAGLGAGLVFAGEFMDQSILDVHDAKLSLDVPVLGAISRITTQEEVSKEKAAKRRRIVIAVYSSISLLIVALLVHFFKQ